MKPSFQLPASSFQLPASGFQPGPLVPHNWYFEAGSRELEAGRYTVTPLAMRPPFGTMMMPFRM